MKSTLKVKKEIDWTRTIVIEDLVMDQSIAEMHKQRIDNIFKHLSEQERAMQLNNIVMRDNIFNAAMNFLFEDFEFTYDESEVKEFEKNIIENFGEDRKEIAKEFAKKIISKFLIFEHLQKLHDIKITDEELTSVLQNYYEQTNQPIRDFMKNEESFQSAKNTLLEEKTIGFIVDKFPKDLSKFEAKLYENLNKAQNEEKKDK